MSDLPGTRSTKKSAYGCARFERKESGEVIISASSATKEGKEGAGYATIFLTKGMVGELLRLTGTADELDRLTAEVAELRRERTALRAVVTEGRRAIGDHYAPDDCYATGPLTGNAFIDLVQCPACTFIAMHSALGEQP